jgi:predicted enzyme related to lactoylglutathione lyase
VASAAAPRVFRVLLPEKDLGLARAFYESLLATTGREVAPGRLYFDCGAVILGILDRSSSPASEFSNSAEALYLATDDLESVFGRARQLGCLAPGLLHGDPASPMGAIAVRPWGERSFYAQDPSGNSLCFVDARTLFTGTPEQIAALRGPAESSRSGEGRPARRRDRD